jgi:pyruvate,water dikinase
MGKKGGRPLYTIELKHAGKESKTKVGSKAHHLAELVGQNIPIPDGFIITSDALNYYMEANDLTAASFEDEESAANLINSPLPPELEHEIASRFAQLKLDAGNPMLSVAVRSSSAAEDLQQASFAGQYETFLHVTDLEHLLQSVKACWASLFSSRVRHYALQKNVAIDTSLSASIGILVQKMVFADVSGVVFSINPVSGDRNEIIINASYGLGEAIVSGIVTPDAYYIDKTALSIRKELGLKEVKIVCAGKETIEVATTAQEQDSFCLSDEDIADLARETLNIEKFYSHPVDIEFAVKEHHVYILQARPITT